MINKADPSKSHVVSAKPALGSASPPGVGETAAIYVTVGVGEFDAR